MRFRLEILGAVITAMMTVFFASGLGAPMAGANHLAPAVISPAANLLQVWALQSENTNANYVPVKPDQALLDAAHFSYITAHPVAYQGQVAAMKAVNPSLRILVYENAVFVQPSDATTYPDSWYLRDANHNKITSHKSGNFLMDPTQPGWILNRQNMCQALLTQSGYDGCYLDMLGLAALRKGFVSGRPIDPMTNQPWVLNEWIIDTANLAGQVRSATSPLPVMGNGLNSGGLFYSTTTPTKPLLDAMDGGIAEAWLRGSTIGITTYHTEPAWTQDVKMLVDAEAAGKPVLGLVKVGVSATQAQQDSWRQYGLATFLMGTQGRSAYFFSPSSTASRTGWHPWYATLVGAPTGSYVRRAAGAYYERDFQYGKVLVNPTISSTTVALGSGTWYTLDRQLVTTSSVSMPADTGLVLSTRLTPLVTVSSGPATPTTSTSAAIAFSSDMPGSTFTCSLDGSQPQACTSPMNYSSLAEGGHLVSVQAQSPGGVVGAATPYSWGIDTTSPAMTITCGPPNSSCTSSPTSATFIFTSTKPASSFTCSLDGAVPVLCASPYTVAGLAAGSHTMTISVTDAYGVAGPPSTWTWTVV